MKTKLGGLFTLAVVGVVGFASRADAISRMAHGTVCVGAEASNVVPILNGLEVNSGSILCPIDRHDGSAPVTSVFFRTRPTGGAITCRAVSLSAFGFQDGISTSASLSTSGLQPQTISLSMSGVTAFNNGSYVGDCGATAPWILTNFRYTE
jgi:hypothetical protein